MSTTDLAPRRHSKTADRPGPANRSPFRSSHPLRRQIAAAKMVAKREEELAALRAALRKATDEDDQRRLTERLLATSNNLESWLDYLDDDSPRDAGSVIIPPGGAQ
jgi:hypothetical protein